MDQTHTDSTPHETVKREENSPTIKTLSDVEKVMKKWLDDGLARECGVKPSQYRIILHTRLPGAVVKIQRGPVVQIHLLWPDVQPFIKTLMRRTFEQVVNRKLVDPLAVESFMVIAKRQQGYRKWLRQTFGDEAEILPDLLPQRRIRRQTIVETTVTLTDTKTGISASVTSGSKSRWTLEHEARVTLSRRVREHEDAHRDDQVAGTDSATAGRGDVAGSRPCGEEEAGGYAGGDARDRALLPVPLAYYQQAERACFEMSGGADFARVYFA